MLKKFLTSFSLFVFLISLTGCATGRKQTDLEIQGLKNQISALEAQVQAKDEEINSLKETFSKEEQQKEVQELTTKVATRKKVLGEVKSRPKIKHIQIALTNAGFDPGPVDGKMGRRTTEAIKAFQRAHGLIADGKVGKRTWSLLRQYLYQQLK
jgi:peptidoglycan hydrolase-like protein with peptidoglycan-binding domain